MSALPPLPGACDECGRLLGAHNTSCNKAPRKPRQCYACNWWNGHHHASCRTKGYLMADVDSERPTERPPAPPKCDCGSNEPNCHSHWCSAAVVR